MNGGRGWGYGLSSLFNLLPPEEIERGDGLEVSVLEGVGVPLVRHSVPSLAKR